MSETPKKPQDFSLHPKDDGFDDLRKVGDALGGKLTPEASERMRRKVFDSIDNDEISRQLLRDLVEPAETGATESFGSEFGMLNELNGEPHPKPQLDRSEWPPKPVKRPEVPEQ